MFTVRVHLVIQMKQLKAESTRYEVSVLSSWSRDTFLQYNKNICIAHSGRLLSQL